MHEIRSEERRVKSKRFGSGYGKKCGKIVKLAEVRGSRPVYVVYVV